MSERRQRTIPVCGGILLVLWLAAGLGWTGWEEGQRAYQSGDYSTALREWLPLA